SRNPKSQHPTLAGEVPPSSAPRLRRVRKQAHSRPCVRRVTASQRHFPSHRRTGPARVCLGAPPRTSHVGGVESLLRPLGAPPSSVRAEQKVTPPSTAPSAQFFPRSLWISRYHAA